MIKIHHLIGILLLFIACSPQTATELKEEKLYVVEVDERNYRIDDRVAEEESTINSIIQPYKAELDKTMDEVIASTPIELIKRRPNGSLNNWVADLMLVLTNANAEKEMDFAIQNYGGVRVPSISKGDITVRQIYELMPFDNKVSILELDGIAVSQLFMTIVEQGGWPVSKEVKIYLSPEGGFKNATISGEPIASDKKYYVSMPDYIANGNSGCEFLKGKPREDLELLIRDGMISYLRDGDKEKLQATLEKRIINE